MCPKNHTKLQTVYDFCLFSLIDLITDFNEMI